MSCFDIQPLHISKDFFFEIGAYRIRCVEVDLTPEEFGQLVLNGEKSESRHLVWLKFDQHVDVADISQSQHLANVQNPQQRLKPYHGLLCLMITRPCNVVKGSSGFSAGTGSV